MSSQFTQIQFVGVGDWRPLARVLAPVCGAAATQTDAMPPAIPAGQGMVCLLSSPTEAALVGHALTDPSERLERWCETVQQALRTVQRQPGQCVLLALDEARRDPKAAAAAIGRHFGLQVKTPAALTPPEPADALRRALAELAMQRHRRALRLHEEMLASCQPVGESGVAAGADPDSPGSATPVALESSAAADLAQALSRIEQLEASALRLTQLQQREAELGRARQVISAERDAAQAALTGARDDAELAWQELHRLQAEVESREGLARQALEQARAKADRDLSSLQREMRECQPQLQTAQEAERLAGEKCSLLQQEIIQTQAALDATMLRTQAVLESEQELQILQAQLHATQEELEKQVLQTTEQKHLADASQKALEALEREHRGMLSQLHQVQEEFERYFYDSRQLQQVAQSAERDRGSLQQHLSRIQAILHAQTDELSEQRSTAQLRHSALESANREQRLLLTQLHQVQEELERYFIDNRRLAAAALSGSHLDWTVQRVQAGLAQETWPHREVNFTFVGLQVAERALGNLPVRLVQHHGRPGLALFKQPGAPAPLCAWQATGQEADHEFMLMVPSDPASAQVLRALGRSDWLLVRALASRTAQAVDERGDGLPARWRAVARRLEQELSGLPPLWRWDQLQAAHVPGAAGVRLQFVGVHHAGQDLGDVQLDWTHGLDRGPIGLEWHLPQSKVPALSGWPLDEQGDPCESWRLNLRPGLPTSARRAQWQALNPDDRRRLLALLEALPGAVGNLPASDGVKPAQLSAQAVWMLRQVHRQLAGPRWKRIARALLGRTRI